MDALFHDSNMFLNSVSIILRQANSQARLSHEAKTL